MDNSNHHGADATPVLHGVWPCYAQVEPFSAVLKPDSHGLLRGGRESGGLVASAAILVSAGTPWTWVASPILSVKLIRGQTPVPTGGAEATARPRLRAVIRCGGPSSSAGIPDMSAYSQLPKDANIRHGHTGVNECLRTFIYTGVASPGQILKSVAASKLRSVPTVYLHYTHMGRQLQSFWTLELNVGCNAAERRT